VTPRHLLIVSYNHPPFPGPGGNRWLAMSRYLRDAGHTVSILASDAFGGLPDDDELGVVRVGDLKSARPLRRLLRRGDLAPLTGSGPEAGLELPQTALLTRVLVPDAYVVSWLPALVVAARRLIGRGEVDCLVTSGPPESVHLAGLLLGRRRPAWIADFRDGWCFEPLRPAFPTAAQRGLDARLERRVASTAEIAVGVTRPIADDLERRLGARTAYVPNGWDPGAAPGPVSPPAAALRSGVVTLVHTGALSGDWGRDPEPLLRALRIVRADPGLPPLRLLHAGRLTTGERELIDRSGVADAVECLGMLPRASALALQRAADALVLVTSRNASEATSKVFEYLAAGRPIVALAEDNEAARIVRETKTGLTVAPDDVDAIAEVLRRVASGELARGYAPSNLERFSYPGPADAVAELVEIAIERKRSRARR